MEIAGTKLPLPEPRAYRVADLGPDLVAALAVALLAVPQGMAYATIAGLPPAAGLYAAAIPPILGSLLRSSRYVIAGPTNALSLLVCGIIVQNADLDPMTVAITLAFIVGVLQVAAGFMRLGALVDYISSPVVLGYVTGAAVMIAAGQLYNATGTSGATGSLWSTLVGFSSALPHTSWLAVAVAGSTMLVVVAAKLISKSIPGALIALALAIAADILFDLEAMGLQVVGDYAPVPSGLPPLTLPALEHVPTLFPFAIACTVLSLVESSSIARSIAASSGERIDSSTEFVGQGFANLSAAFVGGYAVSGSLVRSALANRLGGRTRLVGIASGLILVVILLGAGPLLDHTPVACLAGILLVLAFDLVDFARIRVVVRTRPSDALAFAITLLGTWFLDLDIAIYLGVAVSVVFFLRRARLLTISELAVTRDGHLIERPIGGLDEALRDHPAIRILHVEGSLFFGAVGELQAAFDALLSDSEVKAVVVRMRRSRSLDATTAAVLGATSDRMRRREGRLVLAGMTRDTAAVLERSGVAARIGAENLFPSTGSHLAALTAARRRAAAIVGAPWSDPPP